MKKTHLLHLGWLAVLGALGLASCQVAGEYEMLDQRSSYECTIVASMPQTRTAIDETGRNVSWVADDALTVIYADPGTTTFSSSRFYYSGADNKFKGNVRNAGQRNDWYLLYPYREDNVDATQMHISVQNELVQNGNGDPTHLCGEFFPLYGKALDVAGGAQGLEINVSHALAYLKYTVNNDTESPIVVKSIVLAAPVPICGNFVGDLTADDLTWTPGETASKNLTLTVNDGASIPAEGDADFFFGFVPFMLEGGNPLVFKITAVHPSDPGTEIVCYCTQQFNNSHQFKPGVYRSMSNYFDEFHQTEPGGDTPVVKQNQTLSFANDALTWTLGDVYALNGVYNMPQEVAGAQTTVTYASSKPEVIDITAEGKFMITGLGTTTITAAAAESDEYNPAEKSYTLTVAEAAVVPTSRTYSYLAPNNLEPGTYVIAGAETSELSVALFPTVQTKSWSSTVGDVENGQLVPHKVIGSNSSVSSFTTEDSEIIAAEVDLVESGNGWKIKVNSTGLYLAVSEAYRISYVNESSASVFSISSGTNGATVLSNNNFYFYHTGSGDGFTYRTNSTSNIRFYKQNATKQSQSLSFANPTVTWTLGDTYAEGGTYSLPQASGAVTTVTYDSSNRGVAEIVNNNQVKINGTGSTTITASAAETSSYYGATATMTLVIENGTTPTPTGSVYKRVEASDVTSGYDWSGTYLFVDETSGKAFAAFSANANSGYAVNVTITNGQIAATSDIAPYALTVTDAGFQHANASGQEAYDVQNSEGKYIFYSNSAINIADSYIKNQSSYGDIHYCHAFAYSDGGVQVFSSGSYSGFSKYYLGYSSNAFGYSRNSDTRRVQLYKLTEGTTPTPGKLDQTLSFDEPTVTRSLTTASGTMAVQTVRGAQTSVTYSSSDTDVAEVSGTTITIKSFGSVQIIATAASSNTYNGATAFYTLVINDASTPTATTYQKVSQLTVGGTYVIVDVADQRLFKGTTDGSYVSVSPSNGVITDSDNSLSGYEFTVTQSGSKYCIKKGDQYLLCDYSNQGNSTTGLTFVSTQPADNYLYSVTVNNSVFEFMTAQRNSTSTAEVLYYKTSSMSGSGQDRFKIGASGAGVGVHLYLKTSQGTTPGKQNQSPYFTNTTVTQTMATASGTLQAQAVQDAQGTVTYSSSEPTVAEVSGTTITIKGFGTTIITASAAGNTNYNPGSASYTLTILQSGSSTGNTYVKASALTVGGTYLIVDVADQRLFKGTSDGSYVSVSPMGGVITDNTGSMSDYEFTVTQSGSKYCLKKGNDYLLCDYTGSNSNNTTGLVFESTQPSADYLYSVTVNNSVFEFMTAQRNSTSTQEVLYYKTSSMSGSGQDRFKIGGSGKGVGVHVYLKTSSTGQQPQPLSFAQSTVTLPMVQASGTCQVQTVSGAKTSPVTYNSTNRNVATVNGTTITITGFGSTTIEASAPANSSYFAGAASYTLVVTQVSQEGVFNLENNEKSRDTYAKGNVRLYFDLAYAEYTASNHSGGNGVSSLTYVNDYANRGSQTQRFDWPSPATVTWTSSQTGTLSVYYDASYTNEEIMAVPVISSNSAEIYNLIPNKHYYWVLKNGNTTVASGEFDTEGRRRMIAIGEKSNYGQNFANNCRDLGGQVTTNNMTIKYGKIFRGSNMDSTTPDQKSYIINKMKIGLDVDLRASYEQNNVFRDSPYNFANIPDGTYTTYRGHTQETYSSGGDLTTRSKMGPTLMRIFNAVHNGVNVYVHCMVGADRTGGTCLLLESLLGVPPERCDIDFELTSFSTVGTRTRNGYSPEQYYTVYNAINNTTTGSTWQEKAINFCVNSLGVDRDMITQFQNDMLE